MLRFRFLSIFFAGVFVFGQEVPAGGDIPVFRSGTNLVLVPVAVRDGKGNPVPDLRREDFELFDSGKRCEIVRFSWEHGGGVPVTGPAAAPQQDSPATKAAFEMERFVAFVFDDGNGRPDDFLLARNAAVAAIASLGSGDRVAVYTTSNTTRLEFTSDRAAVRQTLQKLSGRNVLPATKPYVSYYVADQIVNRNDRTALEMVKRDILREMPGTPPTMLDNMAATTARMALQDGELRTRQTLALLESIVQRVASLPGQKAIVLLSPGFVTPQQHFEKNRILDRAVRYGIVIHALDTRGLYVDDTYSASRQVGDSDQMAYDRTAALQQTSVLAEMAEGTGGLLVQNTNDLKGGIARLASAPEEFYILGFAPEETELDGNYHELKIRLTKHAGYSLSARRGYVARRVLEPPQDPVVDTGRELIYSRRETQHPDFVWSADVAAVESGGRKLRLKLRCRPREIRFRDEEGRSVAFFWVVAGVFDEASSLVADQIKRVDLRLSPESLRAAQAGGVEVGFDLDFQPGMRLARVAAWDDALRILSARNLPIPAP